MPAGYSNRSLVEKLGLKPGALIGILRAPEGYDRLLAPLPEGVKRFDTVREGDHFDWIQFFTVSRAELARWLPQLRRAVFPAGALWISWPKKASGVATDLTEDVVRSLALAGGLVDVKVCAVDETWSGLKLVVPLRERKAP